MKKEDIKKLLAEEKTKKTVGRPQEEVIAEARELDKKRSKERKTPTKEEKNRQEFEAMLNYKPSQETEIAEQVQSDDEWDVKIGDKIEYFDPNLSYELTGYRPITKDRGLDFDPKLFTVAADSYRKNGRYTQLLPGTFAHLNHWKEEFRRCRDGITIGKYTLTGENYFFLNYYRLLSVIGDNAGQEIRNEDFPGFLAKQYEYFHYLDLCRKAGFDACAFKARAVNLAA